MRILTDLETALEADAVCQTSECRECSATECPCDQLRDMLFPANGKFDTIAALIAVAEAVDKGKLTAARHSLYPLVKEADHDRA